MTHDGQWCCRTIVGPSNVAIVMQLLEDDERLRVVALRLDVSPKVVIRQCISYQESGQYTRIQVQGRSPMTTPRQDPFLVLLPRRV